MTNEMIEKINEVLKTKKNTTINIVNDKLTISVFTLLENNLKNVKEINFIIRDTKFIPKNSEISQEFEIQPNDILYNSYDITEKNKLRHFAKAKAMHDFIKKYVNVRKVNPSIKIGGNVLIIDDNFMLQGSSSLELPSRKKKVKDFNFNTTLTSQQDSNQIIKAQQMFNQIWFSEDYSSDFKNELLESLEFVYKDHTPEFLYYFTLNELFGNQLDNSVQRFEKDSDKFKNTQIWNTLYDFQKDCVVSAIQKLEKYKGCIIADSVGLGKTFEALAVIKYFEIKMDNVLVLTPAKLYDNWNSFRGNYKDSFLQEVFNYKIMFHTDLSRYKGDSKSGQDLKRFDWGNFDLVVIDESHNFRNRHDRYDDNDNLIMNRYARLMQEVMKNGKNNTKVLLLSATPVNNSLIDLKNQLSLITKDNDSAFESSGITSVDNVLRKSSMIINQWEKQQNKDKDSLLNNLPSDFYKLLELLTIARSRKHITSYYGNDGIGKFPDKNKPITYYPEIDTEAKLLVFRETNNLLEDLNLSVYTPTKYINSKFQKIYIDKYQRKGNKMDFQTQSKGMIAMHRFNLFKRLESSVYSFYMTLERLLLKIDKTIDLVQNGGTTYEDLSWEDDSEYEINTTHLEGKYEIDVNHLNRSDFLYDLYQDKQILEKVYNDAKSILDNNRDFKIQQLQNIIVSKVTNTPYNVGNKKIIIFTAFSDTADYIYLKIADELKKFGLNTACVTGKGNKTTNSKISNDFNSILCAFSPRSKMKKEIPNDHQIDILIGTDCISEGQNLQDCDTVINFDIQWNPVSLIQRFGRIDRIGSTNETIQMINFFPNMELNEYLGLEQRIKGKMTALNIVSTGDEDPLTPELNDFKFRKQQLEKLKDEVIDIEDTNKNLSLTDLNMNEYLYELSNYINKTPEIKKVPSGIYSVTNGEKQGVLICFKHSNSQDKPKSDSSLYPYYLIYIDNNGQILYGNKNARDVVKIFRKLCYGKAQIEQELFEKFFERTKKTKDMSFYSNLLNKAVNSIKGEEEQNSMKTMFDFGGFSNDFANETLDDFELISFLVVE